MEKNFLINQLKKNLKTYDNIKKIAIGKEMITLLVVY